MPVVAVALRDQQGRLLMQQRSLNKHHGGLWEFPGGKVEVHENPRQALCREVEEELAIIIEPTELIPALMADETGQKSVVLFLYTCDRWSGQVQPLEGQEWGWFSKMEAESLSLAPMDANLLERLS